MRGITTIIAILSLARLPATHALSLAVDVGAESTTVAATRTNGSTRDVQIVPDDRGGRSSPSLVGFTDKDGSRVFGTDASSLRLTCPKCVLTDPKSLLGIPAGDAGEYWNPVYGSSGDWIMEHGSKNNEQEGFVRLTLPNVLRDAAAAESRKNISTLLAPETTFAMLLEDAARRAYQSIGDNEKIEGTAPPYVKHVQTLSIAVPGWWSQYQKRQILQSAKIAGFEKTALVSEGAAAAITLGQRLQDEWTKELKETMAAGSASIQSKDKVTHKVTVVLVGVGARNSFACAARFTGEIVKPSSSSKNKSKTKYAPPPQIRVKIEMLQSEWEDRGGGGRDLDLNVAQRALRDGKRAGEGVDEKKSKSFFGSSKESENNADVLAADLKSNNYKSTVRLLTAARRAKEVLSANTDVVLDARGFFGDGGDLNAEIGRDVFESDGSDEKNENEKNIQSNTITNAVAPFRRLLERRGGTATCDFIELVGGGACVPAVQHAIEQVVKQSSDALSKQSVNKKTHVPPMNKRLNLEEAVAVGVGIVSTNATTRSESLKLKDEAKTLLQNKKTGRSTAQRVRALEADADAAARRVKDAPSITDSYPHVLKASIVTGAGTGTVETTVFRPGAPIPSRRVIDIDLVRDDTLVVKLMETARSTVGDEHSGTKENQNAPREVDVFGRYIWQGQHFRRGSSLPPVFHSSDTLDSTPSPFVSYEISGVVDALKKAFASVGQTAAPGATAKVQLHFALDRSGVVVFEKATVDVEVVEISEKQDTTKDSSKGKKKKGSKKESDTSPKPKIITSALLVTEVSSQTNLSDASISRERHLLKWLRQRDEEKLKSDAAASQLEGDVLQARDRLERLVETGVGEDTKQTQNALEKVLEEVDSFLSAEEATTKTIAATQGLRRKLLDAATSFFTAAGDAEDDADDSEGDENSESGDASIVKELEERITKLEEKLEACQGRKDARKNEL